MLVGDLRETGEREGGPPKPPGWLLEARGNACRRGMIIGAEQGDLSARQNSAYNRCDHEPSSRPDGGSCFLQG